MKFIRVAESFRYANALLVRIPNSTSMRFMNAKVNNHVLSRGATGLFAIIIDTMVTVTVLKIRNQ